MLVLRHYSASEIPKCSKYNTRNTFIKVPYKWWHISVSYSMLESQHSSRRVIRVTGNFHDRQEMVFSWKLAAVKSRIVEFWFVFFFPLSFSPSLSLSLSRLYTFSSCETRFSRWFLFSRRCTENGVLVISPSIIVHRQFAVRLYGRYRVSFPIEQLDVTSGNRGIARFACIIVYPKRVSIRAGRKVYWTSV